MQRLDSLTENVIEHLSNFVFSCFAIVGPQYMTTYIAYSINGIFNNSLACVVPSALNWNLTKTSFVGIFSPDSIAIPKGLYFTAVFSFLLFWDWLWSLTEHRPYLCNGTWYQQLKRSCQSIGTPVHALEIWWTLAHKRLITVGEFLPTHKFLHWGTLPALPHGRYYNRQQASFGTCYVVARAYSLEQQNTGRAYAGLCHASS